MDSVMTISIDGYRDTMTEAQYQDLIKGTAEANGWMCYHTADSRRSDKGFPDLICIRGDELFAIEVKTAKGGVRPEQYVWMQAFERVEDIYTIIARPKDWIDVRDILTARIESDAW